MDEAEDGLGEDVEDTVEYHLGVGRDDIAAVGKTPSLDRKLQPNLFGDRTHRPGKEARGRRGSQRKSCKTSCIRHR